MRKRILSIIICLFLLFTLTGCGEAIVKLPFDEKAPSKSLGDNVVAQNSNYTLSYDPLTGGVILTEIATGNTWGTTPSSEGEEEELTATGMPVKKHAMVQSALVVDYRDTATNVGANVYSYNGAHDMGRISCKAMENGVTVEYYFDSQKFMIPVNYVLHDDYVSVSIDTAKIQEGINPITSISIAPFWSSVKNDAEDSYLFVPSGSGAIAAVNSISQQGRNYQAQVFGRDTAMELAYDSANEKDIRLPVYGSKSGASGTFAIIDSGADSALINVTSGSTAYRYSSVYASFQMRGYTQHLAESFATKAYKDIYAKNMIDGTVSVRFYPLAEDKANYNAMANIYRDYLIKECGLKQIGEDKSLSLNFIGGSKITKSFLGVPYTTIYPTTTVSQASDIITEISESVDDNFTVNLTGFGASGVDIGKVGGGFTVADTIGSVSDIKALSAKAKELGLELYMDFDFVNYNKSGNGLSFFGDSVMTSGDQKLELYPYRIATRDALATSLYRLLSPRAFVDAADKLVEKTDGWGLTGVSLKSLSTMSYSDYSDRSSAEYHSKNGFGEAVTSAVSTIKKSGSKFMATDANIYAALAADVIVGAPTVSTNHNIFVDDVPFYALVFKGYIPMTTESVNLAADAEKIILTAVEGGLGLDYTLIGKWDNVLIDAIQPYFYSTEYAGVKDDIIENSQKLSDYYSKVKGAKIASSTIISTGVHCTVFDNGVTVYVNYTNTAAQTPVGMVEAMNFLVLEGAV